MKVIVHNVKLNDSIVFDVDELNDEWRSDILQQVRSRGWLDAECFSEVIT